MKDDDERFRAFTDDDYDDEEGEPNTGSWWPVGVAFAITCWAILLALFVRWS